MLVDELAAAADAVGKDVLSQSFQRVLGSVPALATMAMLDALGPLRPFILPLPTPLELISR